MIDGVLAPEYPHYVTWHSVSWDRSDGTIVMSVGKAESGYTTEIFRIDPHTRRQPGSRKRQTSPTTTRQPPSRPMGRGFRFRTPKEMGEIPIPICLMASDGGNITVVPATADQFSHQPRWSPDSKCLIYAARSGAFYQIYWLDLAAGVPVQLTDEKCSHVEPDICTMNSLLHMLSTAR